MATYKTEQKKALLDFLKSRSGSSYTIEEICSLLAKENSSTVPAKSTVYRLMTSLVEDKLVHRYASDKGRCFLYRITAHESCSSHLHLQCTSCGRVMHLDEQTSHSLLSSVASSNDFSVSETDTVLMGKCGACKAGGNE